MNKRVKALQPLLALWLVVSLLAVLLPLSGCAAAKRIAVEVDGARRIVDTQENTVREALEAEGVV
ncbi:MAG: ubiquitin-like domain-containing protein, partial [Anaerolineae bacterium]|nr:ubiquitin-like domain-containing protein [Anaerolineae bacterium]